MRLLKIRKHSRILTNYPTDMTDNEVKYTDAHARLVWKAKSASLGNKHVGDVFIMGFQEGARWCHEHVQPPVIGAPYKPDHGVPVTVAAPPSAPREINQVTIVVDDAGRIVTTHTDGLVSITIKRYRHG